MYKFMKHMMLHYFCLLLLWWGSNIYIYIPYSAGIDFSRQNLTSVDVRF